MVLIAILFAPRASARPESTPRASEVIDLMRPNKGEVEPESRLLSAAGRRGVRPEARIRDQAVVETSDGSQGAEISRAAAQAQERIGQSRGATQSLASAARAQSFDEIRALLRSHGFPAALLQETKFNCIDQTGNSGPETKIKVSIEGRCCPLTLIITVEFARLQDPANPEEGQGEVKDPGVAPRPAHSSELSREEVAKFGRSAARESRTFGISLPEGGRHLFRVSQTEGNAALVEAIGPDGERKSIVIADGDVPLPHFDKKQRGNAKAQSAAAWFNSFWNCFDAQMNNRVGHNYWLQIASNYVNCWHSSNQKQKWWQKINAFLSCIWNGPNRNHAIASFWACR